MEGKCNSRAKQSWLSCVKSSEMEEMGKEESEDGEYVLDYKERAILEQDELYLQRMARRKRGEEGSAREEIETNMGMANYLQRVMSVEFVTASLKKMLQPPKADDAREGKGGRQRGGSEG